MRSVIKDCYVAGNGGHGVFVGGGAEVEIEGLVAVDNGGDGIHLETLRAALAREFPILASAPPELLDEAIRQVHAASSRPNENALKNSRLGKWLKSQSFVGWASLLVAIAAARG
ncbi:MAG: hypothetical protein AAGJ74_02250 [Pseudomonadota bacterium]